MLISYHYLFNGMNVTGAALPFSPFIANILVLLYGIRLNPKFFVQVFTVSFLVQTLCSRYIDPGFDHVFYQGLMNNATLAQLVFDVRMGVGGLLPFYFLMSMVFGDIQISLPVVHSLFIGGGLSYLSKVVPGDKNQLTGVLFVFCVPSFLYIGSSYNKDYLIAMLLMSLMYYVARPSRLRLIFFFLALISLGILRFYFAAFLVSGLIFYLSPMYHPKLRSIPVWKAGVLVYFFSAMVLAMLWGPVRSVVHEYQGNSTLDFFFDSPAPSATGFIFYPALAVLGYVILPFHSIAGFQGVDTLKMIVGYVDQFFFLTAMIFFYCHSKRLRILYLVLMYQFLHFSIQPFASPNLGSLLRLRLFESVFFAYYFGSRLSEFLSFFLAEIKKICQFFRRRIKV